MKIPYAALLITLTLAGTAALGRELEDLEPGDKVHRKSAPGTDYQVQEVTRNGVWVVIPKRRGVSDVLSGREGPSGTRRVFIARDQVEGVGPLAPLSDEDFVGQDSFKVLEQTLEEDASAADRVYSSGASEVFGPLRAREARLREALEETDNKYLKEAIEKGLAQITPMRKFVRDALIRQLLEQAKTDRLGATKKAWELSLEAEALGGESEPAKADLKGLQGVRGALQDDLMRDLAATIERDPAAGHRQAGEIRDTLQQLLKDGTKAPEDMAKFLEQLKAAQDYSRSASPGPGGLAPGSPLGPTGPTFGPDGPGPSPFGPTGPTAPSIGPLPEAGPGPDLEPAPEVDLTPKAAFGPGPNLGPGPDVLSAPVANMTGAAFEEALRAEPFKVQAELLEAEAEILRRRFPSSDLAPTLVLVRSRLRDANRHLQRVAGEALESDPAAFAAELYRRGEAYELRLRNLPPHRRTSYREALGKIGPLLARARAASRATAKPISQLEGYKALRELRDRIARARANGLGGLSKQLRLEEAEIKRRIR